MKRLTVGELIEKLKEFPPDATILFYDEQYEKVHWGITHVDSDITGEVVMTNQDYGH